MPAAMFIALLAVLPRAHGQHRYMDKRREANRARAVANVYGYARSSADRSVAWPTVLPVPAAEMGALADFFEATGGGGWLLKGGWESLERGNATASDPCGTPPWYGVTCSQDAVDPALAHVAEITLRNNNLLGSLPSASLAQLSWLDVLDVSNLRNVQTSWNWLHGPVPAALPGSLGVLSLAYNNISSSLPVSVGALSSLRIIDLDYCPITGRVPEAVCSLESLEELHVRGCGFTGSLPGCIGGCSRLRLVDFTSVTPSGHVPGLQSLSGTLPRSICNLVNLTTLSLQYTQGLVGTIPDCLGREQRLLGLVALQGNPLLGGPVPAALWQVGPSLQNLFLYSMNLTGALPDVATTNVNLKIIDVDENHLRGPLPASLCGATALEEAFLYSNSFEGHVPACYSEMTRLKTFDIAYNYISGQAPTMEASTGLQHLEMQKNFFSGSLPSSYGLFRKLLWLELGDNSFTSSIPSSYCNLDKLQILYLQNNSLTGTIPACLGNLTDALWLELGTNKLEGTIPSELCRLSGLEILMLPENRLRGEIPPCVVNQGPRLYWLNVADNMIEGNLGDMRICEARSSMTYLMLQNNRFTGSIPDCLATFPLLQALFLQDNDFRGPLPWVWNSSSLISLALSNNRKIDGGLPPSMFHQQGSVERSLVSSNTVLRAVVVEGTRIQGRLPREVCEARELVTLALSGNLLSGELPSCLHRLTSLRTLRASNNALHGKLHESLANLTALSVLDLSENKLSGRLPAALGRMSPQLVKTSVEFNFLSCAIPSSVLDWQQSDAFKSVDILDGNQFTCPGSIVAPDYRDLRTAARTEVNGYVCAGSEWILPLFAAGVVLAPLVAIALWRWWKGLATSSTPLQSPDIERAEEEMSRIVSSITAVFFVAVFVVLPILLFVGESHYECSVSTKPSFGFKKGERHLFSALISSAVCLGLVSGMYFSWQRWVFPDAAGQAGDDAPPVPRPHGRSARSYLTALASWPRYPEARVGVLLCYVAFVAVATIVPNVAYVAVATNSSSNMSSKVFGVVAISAVKIALSTVAVPWFTRSAVNVLHPRHTHAQRFRLRMRIAVVLSSFTVVFAPVGIVLVTDQSCFYRWWYPRPVVMSDLDVTYCATALLDGGCAQFATAAITSSFEPKFAFAAERCVSSFFAIYSPVYMVAVLWSACFSAYLELCAVPALVPWLVDRAATTAEDGGGFFSGGAWARRGIWALRLVTMNASATALSSRGVTLPGPGLSLGALSRRVAERGLCQLLATLLVCLTYGLATPYVACACAMAAAVQRHHHAAVLAQTAGLVAAAATSSSSSPPPPSPSPSAGSSAPDIAGCFAVPPGCAVTITAVCSLVWCAGAAGYLNASYSGAAAFATAGVSVVALVAASRAPAQLFQRTADHRSSKQRLLLEPLMRNADSSEGDFGQAAPANLLADDSRPRESFDSMTSI